MTRFSNPDDKTSLDLPPSYEEVMAESNIPKNAANQTTNEDLNKITKSVSTCTRDGPIIVPPSSSKRTPNPYNGPQNQLSVVRDPHTLTEACKDWCCCCWVCCQACCFICCSCFLNFKGHFCLFTF